MKANIVIDISPPIPKSDKILGLGLWAEMMLASQIARFFKM